MFLMEAVNSGANRPADSHGVAAPGEAETRHPGYSQRVHDPKKAKFLAWSFSALILTTVPLSMGDSICPSAALCD
jgi:hypothetical protein